VKDPRYARRRRAAVPAALAAFLLLVVVSGARTPLTWAGGSPFTPAMTIVLPPQQVAAAPVGAATDQPSGNPLPFDGGATATTPASSSSGGAGGSSGTSSGGTTTHDRRSGDTTHNGQAAPIVRHVFVVMLSQTDLTALAADAGAAPYFARTLVPKGTLLTQYAAVARGSLANGVALLSGQGPTAKTLADCPTAAGAAPADVTPDVLGNDGQQVGDGCVYPYATGTVADQLTGAALDWRGYVEGAAGACPATPRDPFAYFHSLLDAGACARHVAGFDRLDADLARGRGAPALLYLVPSACHDGQLASCAGGAPAGPAAADAFLKDVVRRILASAAYADGGLIAITSDSPPPPPAPTPPPATTTVPPPPAPPPTTPTPPPGQTTPTVTTPTTNPATTVQTTPPPTAVAAASGPAAVPATYPNVGDAAAAGAARVGALLISPAVAAGATSAVPASHFTLLRAISDLFALQPLGYAGAAELKPLPQRILTPHH
jgi:hypothetical protein